MVMVTVYVIALTSVIVCSLTNGTADVLTASNTPVFSTATVNQLGYITDIAGLHLISGQSLHFSFTLRITGHPIKVETPTAHRINRVTLTPIAAMQRSIRMRIHRQPELRSQILNLLRYVCCTLTVTGIALIQRRKPVLNHPVWCIRYRSTRHGPAATGITRRRPKPSRLTPTATSTSNGTGIAA